MGVSLKANSIFVIIFGRGVAGAPANLLNPRNANSGQRASEGPVGRCCTSQSAPTAGPVCRVNSPMRAHKPDGPGRCRDAAGD